MEIKLPTQPTEKKFKLISEFSRTLKARIMQRKHNSQINFPDRNSKFQITKSWFRFFFFVDMCPFYFQ